ncbi:MAG: acetylglutamate kinase [Abditibacteriota bacterium]|nr:acetylglutamate kinase [Abditibacteriota bacterium]MBP5092964.1 acetylglutamate kinase [Abditibacteriota bacterium]MBP5738642.1 acetylglutamate kinase [Abditibacteriota bacterium]
MDYTATQADVLIKALPYIQKYYGKTVVIKYGGNAMIDDDLKQSVIRDVVLMHYVGMKVILIHGGGPDITAAMKKMGKEPEFVNGRRVTDAETMEIVEMVLAGKTNKGIVSIINNMGGKAVGLSGKDASLIVAEKDTKFDLGFVGNVAKINPQILIDLIENDYIPVVSSVAIGADGESYNVNADLIAGSIAAKVKAEKLIMMTDVEGIYRDFEDKSSFVSELRVEDAKKMITAGAVSKGMIPKVEACLTALAGGVTRTHIINGTKPHSLLMELFTDTGIGTMIVP